MASPNSSEHDAASKRNEEFQQDIDGSSYNSLEQILSTFPRETGWMSEYLCRYQGFWIDQYFMPGATKVQQQFRPRSTDILLVTTPKSGTTWLKALIFSMVNRTRLSNCLRQPKDVFVSMWLFTRKIKEKRGFPPLFLEEAFDLFSRGVSGYGPYWEHVLGYYKASLESLPDNILFLQYEEMKESTLVQVKKLAEFVGHPFSLREEESGVVQEIVDLCSFENLQNLKVNRTGVLNNLVKNGWFFRKGEVGDWKNHLTPQMIECLDRVTEQKLPD